MIYSLFGGAIERLRYAALEDVPRFGERLDREARTAIRDKAWVVATRPDGSEYLTHVAKLRADDGWKEITRALALPNEPVSEGQRAMGETE